MDSGDVMKFPVLCDECRAIYLEFCRGIGGVNFCHHAEAGNTPDAGVYYTVAPTVGGGHTVHIISPLTVAEAEALRDETIREFNGPEPEATH